jgi:exodeoxyribonuclease VII large subunit
MDGVLSVSEVVGYLSDLLQEDEVLCALWIQGETSNLSISSAGHCYFTLKDRNAQVRCVLFKHAGRGQAMLLENGAQMIVHGRFGVYEAQGSVQLYVDLVQRAGFGALHLEFEALKARLEAEGLFDPARKRALPALPRTVGVVTSPQAAAFQDICRVLQARFPAVEVILAPTMVQGVDAPAQIVAALQHLGQRGDIDVIIVARGGGSLEDLWAFNDEEVARAIAASSVPVVTGVGHETDTTIADFAADLRAPTPSAAAAAVVPDREEILAQVFALQQDLRAAIEGLLASWHTGLQAAARELAMLSPMRRIEQYHQQLDEMLGIAHERMYHALHLRAEQVRSSKAQLLALDPRRILERGYALIESQDGYIVRSVVLLRPADHIRVRLHDGTVPAVVRTE